MEAEEAKEIYAHFGLTFYASNCLEHAIVNALCFLAIFPNRKNYNSQKDWENLVDSYYEDSFEKTFGQLKKKLESHKDVFPSLLVVIPDLEKCLVERNFLAHHFYREHAQHWFSLRGRKEMIEKLEIARELFYATSRKLDSAVKPLAEKYGLTDELFEEFYSTVKLEAENY